MRKIKGTNSDDVLVGTAKDDSINGKGGDDFIKGMGGDDWLLGGLGNDFLNGGEGEDRMTGGRGSDTYVVDDRHDRVIEHFPAHTPHQTNEIDTVRTTLSAFVLPRNVENLEALGAGDFAGVGNELDNHIRGGAGDDRINGRDGNDHLEGLAGDDVLFGGRGVFTADLLDGGDGNDRLNGATGADITIGGRGNDIHVVDSQLDRVSEAVGEGRDIVLALTSFTLQAGVEVETLIARPPYGVDSIALTGNEFANRLVGGNVTNTLSGMDGNDILFGQGRDDSLIGGIGDDILRGLGGDDTMFGGVGNDRMNGGLGADTIVLEDAFGQDRIVGFTAEGGDRIDLSGLGIAEGDFGTAVQIFQAGNNVRVAIGTDTIVLIDLDASAVEATSFLFA